MSAYINQYKSLFILSWISLYIVFPAWAMPISTSARLLVFLGLILYFVISAYIMKLFLNDLSVGRLLTGFSIDRSDYTYLWLFILCCIAASLHIYPLKFPIAISYDETAHLYGGLGIYIYIQKYWDRFFTFPLQYAFWIATALMLLLIIQKKILGALSINIKTAFLKYKSNVPAMVICILLICGLAIAYFYLLRNMPYKAALLREPPIGKLLYLGSYLSLGISEIGPRIQQILFSLLGSIYLFRTICLFRDNETALLGATIYLFLPLLFFHSHQAELASGTIFFIILTSYYFLRFIKDNEARSLLLASYFIGIGFLYKRDILLMLCICIASLILHRIKNKNLQLNKSLRVILLASIPIIPWMIIGKLFSERNYELTWAHLTSFDRLSLYFSMIPSQISWFLFLLFLFSIVFAVLNKKDALTLHFGILFIAYYLFFTLDVYKFLFRFSMALYPSISFFLAQFISGIIQKTKWKHSFKIVFAALTIYLILICTIWQAPPLHARYITYKNIPSRYYPVSDAMKWIKINVKDGEKILTLQAAPVPFYMVKYGIDRNKIIDFPHSIEIVSTPHKLKTFCSSNEITYILFPYGSPDPLDLPNMLDISEYLKENRDNEFLEVARFNLDGNYIFIYKINNIIRHV